MQLMKRRLGNLERQLLAYAQLRKVRELRTGDLTGPLGFGEASDDVVVEYDPEARDGPDMFDSS